MRLTILEIAAAIIKNCELKIAGGGDGEVALITAQCSRNRS